MKNGIFETLHSEMKCVFSIKEANFNEKIPSEMEIAPSYKLLTLLTPLSMLTWFTVLTLSTFLILFILFKLLYTAFKNISICAYIQAGTTCGAFLQRIRPRIISS